MKLRRVETDGCKKMHVCDPNFAESPFINVIVGGKPKDDRKSCPEVAYDTCGCQPI